MEAETPEERQTRKKNKEKKRQSQYPKEDTDRGEEKSEQPISKYGDQNTSRSSLTGEKEDTEAKDTKKGAPGQTNNSAASRKVVTKDERSLIL